MRKSISLFFMGIMLLVSTEAFSQVRSFDNKEIIYNRRGQIKTVFKYDSNGNITSRVVVDRYKADTERFKDSIDIKYKDGHLVTINTFSDKDEKHARLYDIESNNLLTESFKEEKHSIEIGDFRNGIYIVEVNTPRKKKSLTIIKQ